MSKVNVDLNNTIMNKENIKKLADAINNTNEPETIVDLLKGQDITPDDVNATGKITGDEIVENMDASYYGVSVITSDIVWTPIYVGTCKNGNKITHVTFGSITLNEDTSDIFADILRIGIPSSVGSKLYPYTAGGDNSILSQFVTKFVDISQTPSLEKGKDMVVNIKKESNTTLLLRVRVNELITAGTYIFRIEQTFLLSDSLVGE